MKWRGRVQFRLPTLTVMALTASVNLWLNVKSSLGFFPSDATWPSTEGMYPYTFQGWPWFFRVTGEFETYLCGWYFWGLALDLAVMIVLIGLSGLACEFLLKRRHDDRDLPCTDDTADG